MKKSPAERHCSGRDTFRDFVFFMNMENLPHIKMKCKKGLFSQPLSCLIAIFLLNSHCCFCLCSYGSVNRTDIISFRYRFSTSAPMVSITISMMSIMSSIAFFTVDCLCVALSPSDGLFDILRKKDPVLFMMVLQRFQQASIKLCS